MGILWFHTSLGIYSWTFCGTFEGTFVDHLVRLCDSCSSGQLDCSSEHDVLCVWLSSALPVSDQVTPGLVQTYTDCEIIEQFDLKVWKGHTCTGQKQSHVCNRRVSRLTLDITGLCHIVL